MRKAVARTLQPGSRIRLALLTGVGALILGFVAHGGLRDAGTTPEGTATQYLQMRGCTARADWTNPPAGSALMASAFTR